MLQFLIANWYLVLLALVSGGLLVWPSLTKATGGGGVSPAEAVQLINREKAVVIDVSEPGEYAAAHPDGPIWGHGWDETAWPDPTPPATAELDAVVGQRPAYLARVDVHSALASTALRSLCDGLETARGHSARSPNTTT